jgi:hypothetical protein
MLFEFGRLATAKRHEQGLPKDAADFVASPENSIHWGNTLLSGKDVEREDWFHVWSHNVSGLSCRRDSTDLQDFTNTTREKGVSVLGIQETNRNFEKTRLVQSFHGSLRGVSTHHKGEVSLARIQWPNDYQPGGTAVSVRNKFWATRADKLGRWSWIILSGKGTAKVAFISTYQVCDGASESAITSRTVRAQQEWHYAEQGIQGVNLREQFLVDIQGLIGRMQKEGHDIVLMMDANESSSLGSGVDKLICKCGLADAHKSAQTTLAAPATYQRGSKKIDFILISPRLVESIRAAGILPLNEGYLSDHRALVVDFDPQTFFGDNTSDIVAPSSRRLTSTNPKAVHQYIQLMRGFIDQHCLTERVDALKACSDGVELWCDADVVEWEVLDQLIAQGQSAAEK